MSEKAFDKNAVIKFDVTEQALLDLEQQWPSSSIPADLSIKENYNLVKEGVSTLRNIRLKVEARRKELKADALEYGKKVDSSAKGIKERILAIEEPIKKAKTDYDTKIELEKREKIRLEEERVQGIADRIAEIRAKVEANISSDSATINSAIISLEKHIDVESWADEFCEKAKLALVETGNKLSELHAMKLQSEQAAEREAEAEKKRLAKEEEARVELENEAKRVAEQNAETQRKLDEEKAKLDKEREEFKAELLQLQLEAEAEKKRKADSKKAKKEVEKRTREAFDALVAIMDSKSSVANIAGDVIDAIKDGEIPHVTFE